MRKDPANDRVNRRRLLAGGIAVVGAAALGVARTGRADAAAATEAAAAATTPRRLPLTARATEGPYYLGAQPIRADITDGIKGAPLELRLRVLDESAAALSDVRIDIWHCDSQGNYSGFNDRGDAQGRTRRYLRGMQQTDSAGAAAFRTIYPGWYSGRTTHIHFKVHNATRTLLTSQILLPDAVSQFLYANRPEYRRKSKRDTLNSNDSIGLAAGSTIAAAVREAGDGYIATLDIVVARASA